MTDDLPLCRSGAIGNMAGVAAVTLNGRTGVVRVGIQKTCSGVTVTAFRSGVRMCAVRGRWRLAYSHGAVVAARACPGDI